MYFENFYKSQIIETKFSYENLQATGDSEYIEFSGICKLSSK